MIEFWESLSYATKFSSLGFIISLALGLASMGFLGLGLYFLVSFFFRSYPSINDWHGDWTWPALIVVGMLWSLGFIFGGVAWHFLSEIIHSIRTLRIIYVFILWIWAAILWAWMIKGNLKPT